MQNKKLYYQINELINGLQRLIQNRESALDPISRIELDIALEKVRRLYDLLLQIEVVDSETEKPEETITEVAEVNEISGEPVSESVSENKPGPDMGDISAKDVPVRESTDEEHKTPEAELKTQPNLKATRAKEPDLFSVPELPRSGKPEKTVADKLSEESHSETIADKMSSHKIEGLKKAIGINDKFFFINELFQGDMKEYSETINLLDETDELSQALEYLEKQAQNYNWNKQDNACKKLIGFVERKFK